MILFRILFWLVWFPLRLCLRLLAILIFWRGTSPGRPSRWPSPGVRITRGPFNQGPYGSNPWGPTWERPWR